MSDQIGQFIVQHINGTFQDLFKGVHQLVQSEDMMSEPDLKSCLDTSLKNCLNNNNNNIIKTASNFHPFLRLVTKLACLNLCNLDTFFSLFLAKDDLSWHQLWLLEKCGTMCTKTYLEKKSESKIQNLTLELYNWLLLKNDDDEEEDAKICVLAHLANLSQYFQVKHAKIVLQHLVMKTFWEKTQTKLFQRLNDSPPFLITGQATKSFYLWALNVAIVQDDKDVKEAHLALKDQSEWTVQNQDPVVASIMKDVLQPFGAEEVVAFVERLVDLQKNVHWDLLCALVSSFVASAIPNADKLLNESIRSMISKGLELKDDEHVFLVPALLLARQCCLERLSGSVFQSYIFWYGQTFGEECNTLADNGKKVAKLVQLQTRLVPFEPKSALKTHLASPLHVPLPLKHLIRDYNNLVRTRLLDLEEEKPTTTTFKAFSQQDLEQVDCEIKVALDKFKVQPSKIPQSVLEASIFRKPYFQTLFLPRLQNLNEEEPCDLKTGLLKLLETKIKAK